MINYLLFLTLVYPPLGIGITILDVAYKMLKNESVNTNIDATKISCLAGLFGGIIGYCIVPAYEADLTRYFDLILYKYNHDDLTFTFYNDIELLYIRDVFFHLGGVTQDVHLIPFITGILFYTLVTYMFLDTYKRLEVAISVRNIYLMLFVIIAVISPFKVINNVRCVLSFIVVVFAVYRELIQGKRNLITYLLYIIPLGLHFASITIILIRFASKYIGKYKIVFTTFLLMIPLLIPCLIEYVDLLSIFGDLGTYLQYTIIKANYYLSGIDADDMVVINIYYYFERIYGVYFILIILVICVRMKRIHGYNELVSFAYISGVVALSTLSIEAGAFWRYESIIVMTAPMILLLAKEEKVLLSLINYSLCIPFAFGIAYIYSAVNHIESFTRFFETSYIEIISHIVIGAIKLL